MKKNAVYAVLGLVTGNKDYASDLDLRFVDLLSVVVYRGGQFFRGLLRRLFIKKVKGAFFLGRGARIRHGRLFRCGRSVVIDEGVFIDAFGSIGVEIGNRVTIGRRSTIVCSGVLNKIGHGVEIGNNVGINDGAYIGGQGGVVIMDDVIIGPGVKIFSENHNFSDVNKRIRMQGESRAAVKIEKNCWIGANVTILAGVNIGEGCVIAAGSVVTKSVISNSIVGGVPARVLRER